MKVKFLFVSLILLFSVSLSFAGPSSDVDADISVKSVNTGTINSIRGGAGKGNFVKVEIANDKTEANVNNVLIKNSKVRGSISNESKNSGTINAIGARANVNSVIIE